MQLDKEMKRDEKYYSVGYCTKLDKYVLASVVTWIAWYNRYYEISEAEYNSFSTGGLDELAERLHKEGCNSERFLFSDKTEENTSEQITLRDLAYSKS